MKPSPRNFRAAIPALLALASAAITVQGATACSSDDGVGGSGVAGAGQGGAEIQGGNGGAVHHPVGAGDAGATDIGLLEGDRRMPYTPTNDATFAAFFAEHHRMAIEMANMEAERGSSPEVKDMASAMSEAQTAELKVLDSALADMGADVPPPPALDPHLEAEMAEMSTLSGAALDQMFLLDMIPHHAAGLAPAHRSLPNLKRPELVELAHAIISAQSKEIGEMRRMLSNMGNMEAGEDLAPASEGRADFGLVGDLRISLTPDGDVTFIDFFVSHHSAAVEMADHVILHGADAQVKAMATMMRDTQSAEIETMTKARKALTGVAATPAPPEDPVMVEEMAAMMKLSGAALDQVFLEMMIPHHASALPTSHRANPHLKRAELKELANTMFVAQGTEIGEMHEMLQAK